MKRGRRNRTPWQPPPPPAVAVFHCRRCHAVLSHSLVLLTDATKLSQRENTPLVPAGRYWPVPVGEDFAGQWAVAPVEVAGLGYHRDTRRLIGCCGPTGADGPNRVCACKQEVGTERTDCMWPHAVYLDPAKVTAVAADVPDPDRE